MRRAPSALAVSGLRCAPPSPLPPRYRPTAVSGNQIAPNREEIAATLGSPAPSNLRPCPRCAPSVDPAVLLRPCAAAFRGWWEPLGGIRRERAESCLCARRCPGGLAACPSERSSSRPVLVRWQIQKGTGRSRKRSFRQLTETRFGTGLSPVLLLRSAGCVSSLLESSYSGRGPLVVGLEKRNRSRVPDNEHVDRAKSVPGQVARGFLTTAFQRHLDRVSTKPLASLRRADRAGGVQV